MDGSVHIRNLPMRVCVSHAQLKVATNLCRERKLHKAVISKHIFHDLMIWIDLVEQTMLVVLGRIQNSLPVLGLQP